MGINEWFADGTCGSVQFRTPRPTSTRVLRQHSIYVAPLNEKKIRAYKIAMSLDQVAKILHEKFSRLSNRDFSDRRPTSKKAFLWRQGLLQGQGWHPEWF